MIFRYFCLNLLNNVNSFIGDALARRVYERLEKRLRGLNLETQGEFLYPVRQQLNRSIIFTDPDEMMYKGNMKNTLFHQAEQHFHPINFPSE